MDVKICGEIGINHSGNIETAKKLATVAKTAGCDYVKLQKRDVDTFSGYSPEELAQPCVSPWGRTVADKLRGRELNWDQIAEFDRYCKTIGIEWFASCFDAKSLRELHEYFPARPWNKIAGCMALFPEFLRQVAAQGKPTMISCAFLRTAYTPEGINNPWVVAREFESFECQYVLMHCQALYPSPSERLNLRVVEHLRSAFMHGTQKNFPNCLGVGYSGHETGILPSVLAVQLGARWIERHITLDRSSYGADQAASLEPAGLERMVRDIRSLEVILGESENRLRGDEKRPVKFFRPEA